MVSDILLYCCPLLLHPSQSWVSEIKREENTRHFHDPEKHPGVEDPLPPVRGSNSCPRGGKVGLSGIGGAGLRGMGGVSQGFRCMIMDTRVTEGRVTHPLLFSSLSLLPTVV